MEKLVRRFFLVFTLFPVFASATTVKYWGETSLAHKAEFRDTKIGGLSALAFHDGKVWALSDDKGKYGEPRFYVFNLKLQHGKVQLKTEDVFSLSGLSGPKGELPYLDPEGLVRLSSGDLLISSENNNDRKPRAMPRIFRVNAEGVFKSDLILPDVFLPNSLGAQKKGLQNNAGFEGLSLSADEKTLFAMAEAPVVTDTLDKEEASDPWVRLVKFEMGKNGEFEAKAQYAYSLDPLTKTEKGQEIFRGVSEILALDSNRILVMERGLRLHKTGWSQSVALYEANLEKAGDVSTVKNLANGVKQPIQKKRILDLETDLKRFRRDKEVENFEGLAWGPRIDGKKTLLMISDDNFSKKQKTEFLVFTLENE